ncbi:MAG: hypothetical protein J1E40_01800 [Oscillospiraceae bacterium]|nr:hypothetical protein [Oscillospiraceae bacterium]
MYVNGIVIQKYVSNSYKGIDGSGFSENTGENWYFNYDDQLSDAFQPFYDEHIGMTYWNIKEHSWVAACDNMDYINRYIAESKKRGIPYRLLLCESEIPKPIFNASGLETNFLGYDYAYAAGDNYSAVYNEIPFVFPQFKLNCNGLFDTQEEIKEYILEREKFKSLHPPYTLEDGDFITFRLHEIYL